MQLSIVVPCYNEQEVLRQAAAQLLDTLRRMIASGRINDQSRIYFVDDGSSDGTWNLIVELARDGQYFKGIKLSRNRGHQMALLAGLLTVPGDAVVSIDADLQDDVTAIERMVDAHQKGAHVVFGVRAARRTDSFFKRFTAESYYVLLKRLGVDVVFNHADYRLLSRRALDSLADFGEVNVFLRGLIPQIGFSAAIVEYDRAARVAGESKYTMAKMLALAWDGVTSFSAAPLRMITTFGFLVAFVSIGAALWAVLSKLIFDTVLPGWASTVVPIYFLGGVQLISIGVVGQYVAKIYAETKRRPRYVIDKTV